MTEGVGAALTKDKTQSECSECGATAPKWQGQCPGDDLAIFCRQWNLLKCSGLTNTAMDLTASFVGTGSRSWYLAEVPSP